MKLQFIKLHVKSIIRPGLAIIVLISGFLACISPFKSFSVGSESYVSFSSKKGWFCLSDNGETAPICICSIDFPGVIKIAGLLRDDIGMVTKFNPSLVIDAIAGAQQVVIIGSLGKNPLIDRLSREGKLDISGLNDKWEKFIIQLVNNPFPGVKQALVIAGSDKRGTIYGMFDLSSQIGVSPWYWWADVPVSIHQSVYIEPGQHTLGEPAVKYRGFFINDEAPALSGWVYEKFGGFNHQFYEKVFELLLRLKANYLWPAMWGNAFNIDDTLNPQLADEYGIVMGTSHHEPMLRAQQEWKRAGTGEWNYEKNDSVLRTFWRQGIRQMGTHESIITVGMRGDGDMPMTSESNIALLERIIQDQRNIIKEVTGKEPVEVPQLWALYKEVQDYFDRGMRVPDDITLLLCDDNWGNIRLLPKPEESHRQGGYGVYYHFDYVGGPRNYKWLNTNQIPRIWEQMHLAYEYGVNRIWIVNVGDIKPMELPISFFLDYAWAPANWPLERMRNYTEIWANEQFGAAHAADIADILNKYAQYSSRRKPELLSYETYSLVNYDEAETVVEEYNNLLKKATKIYNELPQTYRDAFYQLVLFPVEACANLNELYVTVAENQLYASQGRALTNAKARKVEELFAKDSAICAWYNKTLCGGKWNHMMDQTHIGYTYWQQPEKNYMPKVVRIELSSGSLAGMALEGNMNSWPNDSSEAILPEFDPFQQATHYIDLFNRGREPYNFSIYPQVPWLHVEPSGGVIDIESRIKVSLKWDKVPIGVHNATLKISTTTGTGFKVQVPVFNPAIPDLKWAKGFIESGGYISMEAAHYTRAINKQPFEWKCIPGLGRTLSGITLFPVTFSHMMPSDTMPRLEYDVYLFDTSAIQVQVYVSPTQNFTAGEGLRYAVAFDEDEPTVVNLHADRSLPAWEKTVADNINLTTTHHTLDKAGSHILKFWALDPGIVLQKLVIVTQPIPYSYLGPPESYYSIPRLSRKK